MRFNLYLKKHHIEILNNFKKVLNDSIIDDVLNHIVSHVINNEDYEVLFKKIRCTGECYMNDNSFEVEIKLNYYEKLKDIYHIYDFDEYPSLEEEVSKVIRCILYFCDQENRYNVINSQNIIKSLK